MQYLIGTWELRYRHSAALGNSAIGDKSHWSTQMQALVVIWELWYRHSAALGHSRTGDM